MKPKAPYALCHKCPFKDRSFAKSVGPADAKIAVVSRSPGKHEALNGKSFAGPSGKVLEHLLELQGVKKEDVLLTNTVLCESDGQEKGFALAQACCEPRLESEIAECDTVIAAGSEAAYELADASSVGGNRGYVHTRDSIAPSGNGDGDFKKQRVIVTNNPAMVLRDDAAFPELVRDFKLAINPLPEPKLPKVKWTEDIDEAREWIPQIEESIRGMGTVAVDIEGGFPNMACIGFATKSERAVVLGIPVVKEILPEIEPLLEIDNVKYLWQFGKYDTKVLRRFGIDARVDEDTGLLSYALDERPGDPESGAGGHSLEWLLKDELGWPRYEPSSVRDFKRDEPRGLWKDWWLDWKAVPKRNRIDLYEYNGMDTAGTLALFSVLSERAKSDNVYDRPYKSQLLPLNDALTQVESYGNIWDVDAACDILEDEVWPKLYEWRNIMRTISKRSELNPNSPTQLVEFMYETCGLEHDLDRPKIERKGKVSTDKYVREVIEKDNFKVKAGVDRKGFQAFIKTLDNWKELDTARKNFLEPITVHASKSADRRVYTTYKIHGTESGRLSSEHPNMQNVLRPKEGLPNVRRIFVADPGCSFISADLSQAELRTIAVLSGDTNLQAIYLDTNRSLHKEIATEFYGEDYTYEEYVKAKNINFGVAYWQSAYSFKQLYHMEQSEAQKFIDFWWERFPQVWEWTKEMERTVLEDGVIQSPFGHKRRFYVIPQDTSARIHIVKEGINFLPQNIAANITLFALTKLVRRFDPRVAQIRITVHDSIVANVRESEKDAIAHEMKVTLESAAQEAIGWDFPYKAEISVGPTWGDLVEQS
jgi:uracil-DNA glycosylase family 4